MAEKLELKSCHEVIDTVDVANIESIFYGGKLTDPDILTVVMKGGKRLYCDEVCSIDSLQEENSFDAHIQEGDKITVNEDGSRFNRSQLERTVASQSNESKLDAELNKWRNHYIEVKKVGCELDLRDIEVVARHFAEWQHKQDESLLQDHVAYKKGKEYGYNKCRREIMKLSIERTVKVDAGGYPYIDATELYDYDNDKPLAKAGDKVKVMFIKD